MPTPAPLPGDTTLVEFFERHFLPRHLVGVSPRTILLYRILLRHFDRFLERFATLADLSDANLLAYCPWRLQNGANQTTTARDFHGLHTLWEWAARRHYTLEFPDCRSPCKPLRRVPTAWKPEEVSRLVAGCAAMKRPIGAVPGCLWWQAFIIVGLHTGLRHGALLALRWEDVDLESGTMLARAESAKTYQDEIHRIGPDAVEALKVIREPPRELVFASDLNPTTYGRQWDVILRPAGLPGGRRCKTHKLRRTSGFWVAQLGGIPAAQEHLGHTNIAMTVHHYIDKTQLPETDWTARFPQMTVMLQAPPPPPPKKTRKPTEPQVMGSQPAALKPPPRKTPDPKRKKFACKKSQQYPGLSKRRLKAKAIKAVLLAPGGSAQSDNQIAATLGVVTETVARYRKQLQSRGEIQEESVACEHCGTVFTPTMQSRGHDIARRFCSLKCRFWYWRNRKRAKPSDTPADPEPPEVGDAARGRDGPAGVAHGERFAPERPRAGGRLCPASRLRPRPHRPARRRTPLPSGGRGEDHRSRGTARLALPWRQREQDACGDCRVGKGPGSGQSVRVAEALGITVADVNRLERALAVRAMKAACR